MIYIDNKQSKAELLYTAILEINDTPEEILILCFPQTNHSTIKKLLTNVTEITDEQERTVYRYTPTICYDVSDMEGKTYAKLRISSKSEAPNPNYVSNLDTEIQGIKDQLTTLDDTAIQMFEASAAQEEINNAQDESLIELYELIGSTTK